MTADKLHVFVGITAESLRHDGKLVWIEPMDCEDLKYVERGNLGINLASTF